MPEKLSDTLVLVHTKVKLQESCPRVENSKELEVEEDQEVSRFKLVNRVSIDLFIPIFTFNLSIITLFKHLVQALILSIDLAVLDFDFV